MGLLFDDLRSDFVLLIDTSRRVGELVNTFVFDELVRYIAGYATKKKFDLRKYLGSLFETFYAGAFYTPAVCQKRELHWNQIKGSLFLTAD